MSGITMGLRRQYAATGKLINEEAALLPIDKQNTTQRGCCMESGERRKGLSPEFRLTVYMQYSIQINLLFPA